MRILNQLDQAFFENMGVDLSGCYIGMAEKLLNRSQVRSILQEMARKGVAQNVR